MKKQGFTLIELMVVIVIMGILAAVAVPKLFGMIAKSKASEVGPAAGTYVKLQDAYFSEKNKFGGWELIGYVAPGGSAGAS
ncbi:MAG: type II secretion system protein, partial [Fibrobacter sp.]|nr:type II secretion system protein [Fibrobacter sp.]